MQHLSNKSFCHISQRNPESFLSHAGTFLHAHPPPVQCVFFRSSHSSLYFCNLSSAHSLKAHQLFVLFSPSFAVSLSLVLSAHFLFMFRMVSERKSGNFSAACRRSAARMFTSHTSLTLTDAGFLCACTQTSKPHVASKHCLVFPPLPLSQMH